MKKIINKLNYILTIKQYLLYDEWTDCLIFIYLSFFLGLIILLLNFIYV